MVPPNMLATTRSDSHTRSKGRTRLREHTEIRAGRIGRGSRLAPSLPAHMPWAVPPQMRQRVDRTRQDGQEDDLVMEVDHISRAYEAHSLPPSHTHPPADPLTHFPSVCPATGVHLVIATADRNSGHLVDATESKQPREARRLRGEGVPGTYHSRTRGCWRSWTRRTG